MQSSFCDKITLRYKVISQGCMWPSSWTATAAGLRSAACPASPDIVPELPPQGVSNSASMSASAASPLRFFLRQLAPSGLRGAEHFLAAARISASGNEALRQRGARLEVIGRRDRLPKRLLRAIEKAEAPLRRVAALCCGLPWITLRAMPSARRRRRAAAAP